MLRREIILTFPLPQTIEQLETTSRATEEALRNAQERLRSLVRRLPARPLPCSPLLRGVSGASHESILLLLPPGS